MTDHVPQRVVIAGGHGQVALVLTQLLIDHGDQVVSLLSNPNHSTELQALGAEPVYLDLEQAKLADLEAVLEEAGAVVFASGAGEGKAGLGEGDAGNSIAARMLADAAEIAQVPRYLHISAVGAGDAAGPDGAAADADREAYLAEMAASERTLRAGTDLGWTILRVGTLTEHEPSGTVTLATAPPAGRDEVTVSDAATVVLELIERPVALGETLNLVDGDTPILAAIDGIADAG